MKVELKSGEGIYFKIRFNTTHGDTALYWRVIIDEVEYLATSLQCLIPTYSDASFDKKAGMIKYHIAGKCYEFYIDDNDNAFFK